MKKVAVIGAGASGMMAAITASDKGNRVSLYESQPRVGRKILSTGNGRCNLTNKNACEKNYHGEKSGFVRYALERFGAEEAVDFFRSIGLVTVEEKNGRVYPLSDSSTSVLDVLRYALENRKTDIRTDEKVLSITNRDGKFTVRTEQSNEEYDAVIIACGGKAGGKVGGCSDGYELLKSFGHHMTKIYPALVPVTVENDIVRSLKGIRADARIVLNGKVSEGEMQFTENGISGPAVFDISRSAAKEGGTVKIDILKDFSEKQVKDLLTARANMSPDMEAQNIFTGVLQSRLGLAVVKYAGVRPSLKMRELDENEIEKIAGSAKNLELKIKGTGSFDMAQVTVGGIRTDEFDDTTMQSRYCRGLFACGEVLDIDGDCGGYNLQWAWSSGKLAGESV